MRCVCGGTAGVTHRPDVASENAVLRRIRSLHATSSSFDAADSLDLIGATSSEAAVTAADAASLRHSTDCLLTTSSDPLNAPPDFLRPMSGPTVPPGCRTKLKYVHCTVTTVSSFLYIFVV